jgi:hypothetical protein
LIISDLEERFLLFFISITFCTINIPNFLLKRSQY